MLLHGLTHFINLEKDSQIPDEWYDYNTSAILVANGDKMRPLGMDSTGRKLVSVTFLAKHSKDMLNEFAQFQLSCMVKNGCEVVVHLLRQMHELMGSSHVKLTLDVSNAFNAVSRLQGLLSIAQSLPGLYTYANCIYRRKNTLWMDGPDEQLCKPIKGQEGSTQGAVGGGVFFNTAMNHVLKKVNAILAAEGAGTVVAIADDIVGRVTPQMVRRVLDIVTERFRTLHLSINYDKCYIHADAPDLLQQLDLLQQRAHTSRWLSHVPPAGTLFRKPKSHSFSECVRELTFLPGP